MNTALLSMVMDILIIVLLGGTIFYAHALSKQLKIFRKSRADFENLLMQLTGQINTAHDAIDHMQEAAGEHGEYLSKLIREAKLLADELIMVNETGESLANRIERAASRGGSTEDFETPDVSVEEKPVRREQVSAPSFAIRDKDVESGEDDVIGFDEVDDEVDANFHSKAERELFAALKRGSR